MKNVIILTLKIVNGMIHATSVINENEQKKTNQQHVMDNSRQNFMQQSNGGSRMSRNMKQKNR